MYVHPAFKVHPSASLAFAGARGFGLVIACDSGRPVASPLPFRLIEQDGKMPKLEFHVARVNPLGAMAEKGGTWLVSVTGHDAYVSPDWYASPEQVPTWLYETVQLSGPVRVIPGEHTQQHSEALSAKFESWLAPKPPWLSSKVTAGRLEALKKAIVGLVMTVEQVEGSFKLNQHKSDVDHLAIASALTQQRDAAAQAIGDQMVALRPQLDYISPLNVSMPADGRNTP